METVVELEGVNGEWFTLAGPREGDRGVHLGTGVEGLYDPPVKVVYEEPGNYPGARYMSHRILRRDIVFGVEILDDKSGSRSWLSRDSEWRKAWAFDRDSRIHVTTTESGHRYLKCRLGESPDISLFVDPKKNTINRADMTVVAGDPFWYEDDVVYEVETQTDTRFTPSLIDGAWSWDSQPKETLVIEVDPGDFRGGLNPTDQYIFPKWTLPAATEKPDGIDVPLIGHVDFPWEKAPFTQFVIPDYSFENDDQASRRLRTPGLVYGEDCVVNTDPREEQFAAANGAPVWSRTNGVRFRNSIPPYTKSARFEIIASGCAPGQMITLRLPRPWSRPWGLE